MPIKWITLLLVLLPSFGFCQDSIFVPIEPGSPVPESGIHKDGTGTVPVPNSVSVLESGAQGDAMERYVVLQAGLDNVVYAFDEQAAHVKKHTQAFEVSELKKRESRFLNPDQPPQRMTFTEQARYDLLIREPTLCSRLDEAIRQYVSANSLTLDTVVQQLKQQTETMDDAAKQAFAQRLQTALAAARPHKARVESILYQCLYKNKNDLGMPRDYSVEKSMRNWFMIQQPLIDAWIGNVD